MSARRIIGPQQRFERDGVQRLRDVRSFASRFREFLASSGSGFMLAGGAGATFLEPALVDLAVPVSVAYTAWVLMQRVTLPMRLPITAHCRDHGDPMPGTRRARRAAGTQFIGWDMDGSEIWITADDARQHIAIPGTTGSGKTSAILSQLANALAHGSGFVLVDAKADRNLFAAVSALLRRFGREDDLRLLNFMVASGAKDSNTWNTFATGNADAMREVLNSLMGEQSDKDANGVFRARAGALAGTLAPVWEWLRDNCGVVINIETIRDTMLLGWIWRMGMDKVAVVRDPFTGEERQIDLRNRIPDSIIAPLRSYLGELPGYQAGVPLDKQKGEEPSKQHGFALFYFTAVFTQLIVSLGHIFNVANGDIDMRDIVLNRRVLLVSLPALENSDATLAALGKLVVSSLRGMMAQLLGVSVEGTYTAEDKAGMGDMPYPIVFDELASYAAPGLDRMLQQGRGLNVSFILGFQEVSGVWAKLGENTASLLGNANFTAALRQQDSGRTREWLEKRAGQVDVTQATSYSGGFDGSYREDASAQVRQVCRVDWRDLVSLIEGEAIMLSGERRIYGKMFFVGLDDSGPKRLGRTLPMREPDPDVLLARIECADQLAARIAGAKLLHGRPEPVHPSLHAILAGFAEAARSGQGVEACVQSALARVALLPEADLPSPADPPSDGSPFTGVTPMLAHASRTVFGGSECVGWPQEPVDVDILRRLAAIESFAGVPSLASTGAASTILAERDEALDALVVVEPPQMTPEALTRRLDAVISSLNRIAGPAINEAKAA